MNHHPRHPVDTFAREIPAHLIEWADLLAGGEPMDEGMARTIAGWWHGGQWSGLYSFASAGFHVSRIADAADEARRDLANLAPDTSSTDAALLAHLAAYLAERAAPYIDPDA